MKNFKEGSGIFRNEVELEELEQPIFLKKFYWGETISSIMKFIERLEDENINYAIETNCRHRCQIIYISSRDKENFRISELSS